MTNTVTESEFLTAYDLGSTAYALGNIDVTPKMLKAADSFANVCVYTTTAIAALAQFHDENGDEAGAKMLRDFAIKFAEHEDASI